MTRINISGEFGGSDQASKRPKGKTFWEEEKADHMLYRLALIH